jgi:hypothetical protein
MLQRANTRHVVSVRSSHHFTRLKLQEISVADAAVPDECRTQWTIHTPYEIDPEIVLRHFYESIIKSIIWCQTLSSLIVDNRSINLKPCIGSNSVLLAAFVSLESVYILFLDGPTSSVINPQHLDHHDFAETRIFLSKRLHHVWQLKVHISPRGSKLEPRQPPFFSAT